ncbi:epoxide hydrolase family protein [Devosia sp. LjRoot3]|uniref:epoxide hydrolase family protein n=1 Tax=Devosia sp. LjRoot3 TaxID=3342319 RepID=UPI003ECDDF1C
MNTFATPFQIAIPDRVLDDLRSRISNARLPKDFAAEGWGIGTSQVQAILDHWVNLDWRRVENQLNSVPAFTAEIDGLTIHFVHALGQGKHRIPIVLTNGWPSCFTELLPLVPLLTADRDGISFDVIIPSLPGYGFSDRPDVPGTNITRIAKLWSKLMEGLGYQRFLAHGSDMGLGVVDRLRANHADQVLGVHMANVMAGYPAPDDPSPAEAAFLAAGLQWQMQEAAYAMVHATKPMTIASGLNDSPAGLAAWIGEKFLSWTEVPVELDDLCTVLTIYWATETIGSSQRLYKEAFADLGVMSPPPKQGVPVAVCVPPNDIRPAPRDWAERWLEIAQWTELPIGGHFPAYEVAHLLAADIRKFAQLLS